MTDLKSLMEFNAVLIPCLIAAVFLHFSPSQRLFNNHQLGMLHAGDDSPASVAAERAVFYRETAASMYSPAPYSFATGVAELPYLAAQAVIMVTTAYWLVCVSACIWLVESRERICNARD